MKVRRADDRDRAAWDEYVRNVPGSSPYHAYAWGKAIEEAYGHSMHYLVAEHGSTITGVLPLVALKPPMMNASLVSLPFCDMGGCLSDDDESARSLMKECLSIGEGMKAGSIEIRCGDAAGNWLGALGNFSVQTHKVRMVLELPGSAEELLNGFVSKLRSQIRKAGKHGLEFKFGGPESVNEFYSVFSRNMRELGSPVHSRRLFEAVTRNFGERAKIGIISNAGAPIGAGLILCHEKTMTIPWASTLREFNHLAPNMLLYWSFLSYAADAGYKSFCFGRSTPGEGTYNFKKQWGAEPRQLYWYSNSTRQKDEAGQSGPGPRAIIEAVWKKMPLNMANAIGPLVRKYISL